MRVTLEDFVLSGGDVGRYQVFIVLVSSLTIFMHTFALTLEVFTGLTPTCYFTDSNGTTNLCRGPCNVLRAGRGRCSFEYDEPELSIVSEFNLIGPEAYKSKIVSSYAFLGYIFGCVFWGWLGDKIGRLPCLHICQGINTLILFATSRSPNFLCYALARTAAGFTACHWNTACVYAAEWGGSRNRSLTLVVHIVYGSIAFALFGTIAYFIRPWRDLVFVLSIVGAVIFLLMLPALRESPRWLFCHSKKESAVRNVQFASKMNGLLVHKISNVEDDIYLPVKTQDELHSSATILTYIFIHHSNDRELSNEQAWGSVISYRHAQEKVQQCFQHAHISRSAEILARLFPGPSGKVLNRNRLAKSEKSGRDILSGTA
eukprot:sb/3465781/